jgi:HK97 family phage prohead protease
MKEIRVTKTTCEFRSDENGALIVSGYAAVFNSKSEDMGGWVEVIKPGAFSEALVDCDCRALFNHDANQILGRTTNSTLVLSQDAKGLAYSISLPDTTAARDLAKLVERGDISGSSFSFVIEPGTDEWVITDDETVRVLTTIKRLYDVGPVTFPAYPATLSEASRRSMNQLKNNLATSRARRRIAVREKALRAFGACGAA